MAFRGEHYHAVDDKGRVIIPLKFRSELGATFVITKGVGGCLFIYREKEFQVISPKKNRKGNRLFTIKDIENINKFKIVDARRDPGYGYEHVWLLLIRFRDKNYGLCIYDTRKKEFIEEPANLNEYDVTLDILKQKYGLCKY